MVIALFNETPKSTVIAVLGIFTQMLGNAAEGFSDVLLKIHITFWEVIMVTCITPYCWQCPVRRVAEGHLVKYVFCLCR